MKACDRLDNLRSLKNPGTTREFVEKQVAETRGKYYSLFDRMMELVPPEYRAGAMKVRDEIRAVTEAHHASLYGG